VVLMDYGELIQTLTQSYSRQVERYKELQVIVQKILGQIAVSRGNFSGVMGFFEKKQHLLEIIEQEREQVKNDAELWQKEKDQIPTSESTAGLYAVLAETELAIKAFLETEDQLQKCLEHHMAEKGNSSTT